MRLEALFSVGALLLPSCQQDSNPDPLPVRTPAGATSVAPEVPELAVTRVEKDAVRHQQLWRRVFDDPPLHQGGIIVPQVPDPKGVFLRQKGSPLRTVDTSTGVLVCRIKVGGKWDVMGLPDPIGTLRFEGMPDLHFAFEDTRHVYFSLPKPPVKHNSKARLTLFDQDNIVDESMGSYDILLDGRAPFVGVGTKHQHELQCRFLGEAKVENFVQALVARAIDALARPGKAPKPIPGAAHFGYEQAGFVIAWKAVDAIAGYLGWEHATTREQLEILKARHDKWVSAVQKRMALLQQTLKPPAKAKTELSDFEIQGTQVVCDEAQAKAYVEGYSLLQDSPCFIQLGVTGRDTTKANTSGAEGLARELMAVDGEGFDVAFQQAGVYVNGKRLARPIIPAGEHGLAIYVPKRDVAIGSHAGASPANRGGKVRFLRLCTKGKGCLARLE